MLARKSCLSTDSQPLWQKWFIHQVNQPLHPAENALFAAIAHNDVAAVKELSAYMNASETVFISKPSMAAVDEYGRSFLIAALDSAESEIIEGLFQLYLAMANRSK